MSTPGATWLYYISVATDGKIELLDPKNAMGDDAAYDDDDLES